MVNELHGAVELANRLLDEPNADPDDDLRVLSRHLMRQRELHERYKKALWTANGHLIQHGCEPVKLGYPSSDEVSLGSPVKRFEMDEQSYVDTANLAKLRIAYMIIRDCLCMRADEDEKALTICQVLRVWIGGLENTIGRHPAGP